MNGLIIIENQGQRVLTTQQLAKSYGTEPRIINNNYLRNKERYTSKKHFFLIEGEELKKFKTTTPQIDESLLRVNKLYLWTEKGAMLHAKSVNTDKAWQVYDHLIDTYFRVKKMSLDLSQLSPELQMFKQIFDSVAKTQLEQKYLQQEITSVREEVAATTETIQNMKDTILTKDEDWRYSIKTILNKVAKNSNMNYQEVRIESYRSLEDRGRCKLSTRVGNLKRRLKETGATKTQINRACKLDVIENEPRLKEIYTVIVKEMSIKYVA